MPIDGNVFPDHSPLISEALEDQMLPLLSRVLVPITVACVIDQGEKSREQVLLLRHIARLCPRLTLRLLSPGEEPQADQKLDASLLPATGFYRDGVWSRVAFHGVPGGQELTSFMSGLLAVSGAAKPLDKPTLKEIGKIKKPASLMVCVSLSCHHCAQLVMHAHRIAVENPLIHAHMVDANLYPQLVEQYSIQRVPLLLVDGQSTAAGGMTLPELCTLLRKRR